MNWLLRILVVLVVASSAYHYVITNSEKGINTYMIPGAALLFLIVIFIEERRGFQLHPFAYLGGFLGALAGLVIGILLGQMPINFITDQNIFSILLVLLAYLGYTVGTRKALEYTENLLPTAQKGPTGRQKVLDTSVIIDGRIYDICNADFIEGTLIAPQFVLNELQHIADSTDPLKKARGRRGLDILKRLQKSPHVKIEITDADFPKILEVDAKIIALAKDIDADILTNDYNLNKVAQIQGINVLNINQLADAVKPVVLPGETMNLVIAKQGKEKGQGVAYLDDGTMVVVEHSDHLLTQAIDVTVTSILQTSAGRMIFAAPKNGSNGD